ncbi:DUF4870 family protein [Methylobacter sp. YRD-M1]|uniref:DUF4870 family protein n=1 Tax=Methylobacter sp. YRD-M1 TaxID=2911520 RepID=UPI00227BAF80|nr:hypothetical protein [Methylobacter sp. YRD-M1]WAK03258.1 hypothetical protein LZ558_05595 [Methylobacter sp. YRD-M1]
MADSASHIENGSKNDEKLKPLKTITAVVYLCQVLAFALAGLPFIVGAFINLAKRKDVQGTWLESHFNWQIRTFWIALALFAISRLMMFMGGSLILTVAVLWLGYRIAVGWYALHDNKPIDERTL